VAYKINVYMFRLFSCWKISSFCIFCVGICLGKMQNVLMSVGKKSIGKKNKFIHGLFGVSFVLA